MMGRIENSIDNQIDDYLLLAGFQKDEFWRNQVLNGFFRGFHSKKEYVIKQGITNLPDKAVLLLDGKTLYVEVKREHGRRSKGQLEFEEKCLLRGTPFVFAESALDVSCYLKDYFKGTKWEKKIRYIK